ncbi:MAG: redoxin domain-containing protein [Bacteroidota bacterium]|jgi:peroxiredoxin
MALSVGQKAPDFSLYNSDKQKVNLSDYSGKKVLVLFFPQAFSSICTTELCTVRDDIAKYESSDAQVLAISVDSVNSLNYFKKDQGYTFTLLSDFNKETSRAYDAIYENWVLDMKGVSKRSAFVIDREGIIQYAEVLESPADIPNFEAIQATISKIA